MEKLLRDFDVNDLLSSFNDANITYEFYQAASEIIQRGGFIFANGHQIAKNFRTK